MKNMKSICICMFMFLGSLMMMAQSDKKGDFVDLLLHERAADALEKGNFIIRIYSNSVNTDYDDRYCFLEIDDETVSYQMYDGRADGEPWTGLTHAPIMYQGTVSDMEIDKKANGDIHLTALLYIPYKSRNLWWNIVLNHGSNECTISKSKVKGRFKGFYKGKLFPIGATTIMKGEVRR